MKPSLSYLLTGILVLNSETKPELAFLRFRVNSIFEI